MLIRRVVQHHFDNDPYSTLVSGFEEFFEIVQGSIAGMDGVVIRDIVAVVAQRGRKEWHQPDGVDAEFLQVVELLIQSLEVTDAVSIAVVEGANVDLVDDRVLVPKRILL